MAKVVIKLNSPNIGKLLKGAGGVDAVLRREGEQRLGQLPDGFVGEFTVGLNRARYTIRTDTFEAILAESNDHVLSGVIR